MLLKAYLNRLDETPLFYGIDPALFEPLLAAFSAQTSYYKKSDVMLEAGKAVNQIGILLSGEAVIIRGDFLGEYTIIGKIQEGEIYGEVLAGVHSTDSPINIVAAENSASILLDYNRMMLPCHELSEPHMIMMSNLMRIMARKNMLMERKLEILQKRTMREKLLTFLEIQREVAVANTFVIPYNREELSEYLCVDRSALSRELCRLQEEGLITFKKNLFTLHEQIQEETRQ